MTTYKTLIIDDEKIARARLTRLLDSYSSTFHIIGEASNGDEALEMIKNLQPDLIFLDVQMPGRTGFEVLQELTTFPIVVFCTAYEEYALQAFNTLALDYLVKPVDKDRLELTVDKLNRMSPKNITPQLDELINLVQLKQKKVIHSIPHKVGDRVILVKPEMITHFEANEKYVDFYTTNGKKYMTELSLKKLEDGLPDNFKRVHRGIVVNTDHIREYRKYFRGKYILVMNDIHQTRIETGRSYSEEIKQLIEV
ncbi:response regulator transcription factor [Puteibacter caeruleilacunae]|nr:response regulator transcription factor [Puteibacter caeruleilacunae]